MCHFSYWSNYILTPRLSGAPHRTQTRDYSGGPCNEPSAHTARFQLQPYVTRQCGARKGVRGTEQRVFVFVIPEPGSPAFRTCFALSFVFIQSVLGLVTEIMNSWLKWKILKRIVQIPVLVLSCFFYWVFTLSWSLSDDISCRKNACLVLGTHSCFWRHCQCNFPQKFWWGFYLA